MDLIEFQGKNYPLFQSIGNASQFAIPYAKYFCKGVGYDIGCMKNEWSYPGSIPIDLMFDDEFHATHLPMKNVDYIYSSHCLEHVDNWFIVMDYWYECLKTGGILFLYLPHYDQEYWRPWYDTKHKHILTPKIIYDYMITKGYKNIFVGKKDLNCSFMIVGEK
jgi:predicted SAM-dependent methyltransferase